MLKPIRLVPDDTAIRFMRGRFVGLIVSAILSTASIVLFFYPGLNYSVDFKGGVAVELLLAKAVDLGTVRADFNSLNLGQVQVQQFGSARDVLVTFGRQAEHGDIQPALDAMLRAKLPGTQIRSLASVGSVVSSELFWHGLTAVGLAFVGVLIYIWFRFDWQFGIGVVGTMILDVTKTIGFFAITRLQFDLDSVAAIMLLIGYSVTDKIVVFDRIRENLRKHKVMPLRELIDLSINQMLGRTVATSLTVLLSISPLAILGTGSIRAFALAIIFGIIIGTSSSIFIASPILLILGQRRLRPALYGRQAAAPASTAG